VAVAAPARLTVEQAATVFRRAAELEAAGVRGDAVLDDQALEDAGREVGLYPASIREALAELRGGALVPGPAITWGTVSSSRAVAGPRGDVLAALDDVARRNLLGVVRSTGAETVWARSPGLSSVVVRSLRGRRHHPLLALTELRATLVEAPSRPIRVRLEGSLVFPWRLLTARSQLLVAAGLAGGATLSLASPGLDGLDAAGALAAAVGFGSGLKSYRRSVLAVEVTLDGILDCMAVGLQVPPHQPPEDSWQV
jgi:hypothetical protein